MTKFRSWNEKESQFYYFEDGLYFKTLNDLKKYEKDTRTYKRNLYCDHTDDFNWQNAEMSTGLKDMNKIEIFSGDIVGQRRQTCINGRDIIIHKDFIRSYLIKWDFENTGFGNVSRAWALEKLEIIGNKYIGTTK